MGITPTLPLELQRLQRPDVAHVFGFRDPVTTGTAAWCRLRGIPYVFEPLGMFQPRLRKVVLKRALDATLYRGVARGAAAVVVASERERDDVVACGRATGRRCTCAATAFRCRKIIGRPTATCARGSGSPPARP